MATVFDEPPVLCGHRGMGAGSICGEAENTAGSLLAAVAAGLHWVEIDVRLSADEVLVARHDATLEDGRLVAEVAASESALPRLDDLLEALPADVAVDVEIKSSLEDALRPRARTTAGRAADRLAREQSRRTVLVTSFDPAALVIVRERGTSPVGLLTWMRFPLRMAVPAAVHLGADVLAPHISSFGVGPNAAWVERAPAEHVELLHSAGVQVAAWCPTPAQAGELLDAGVDCLIVDHVERDTWVAAGIA